MNSTYLCVTYQAFVCITIFRKLTRDCECENNTKQNYLDGSAFAMVILRAKHAAATVLHI